MSFFFSQLTVCHLERHDTATSPALSAQQDVPSHWPVVNQALAPLENGVTQNTTQVGVGFGGQHSDRACLPNTASANLLYELQIRVDALEKALNIKPPVLGLSRRQSEHGCLPNAASSSSMIAPSVPSYRPTDDNGQALDPHSDCGGASNAVTDDWWECYIDFDGGSGQHADSPGSSIEDITTSNTELDGLGSNSPFTAPPRSRYHCTYPGCDKDYARESGRKRHMLSHDPLPRFSCDFPGCSRFGADGFTRKDKFNDHKKTHSC